MKKKIYILMLLVMISSVSMAYTWPTGVVVNPGPKQDFGPRNVTVGSKYHNGIDIGVPIGTKCLATADGTVINVDETNARGIYIDIRISDHYVVRYQHLSRTLFKVGDKVTEGQPIALSGNTGVGTGPHLHYEVLKDGKPIDPIPFLKSAGSASSANEKKASLKNLKWCSCGGKVETQWYYESTKKIHYRRCSKNHGHQYFEASVTKCTGVAAGRGSLLDCEYCALNNHNGYCFCGGTIGTKWHNWANQRHYKVCSIYGHSYYVGDHTWSWGICTGCKMIKPAPILSLIQK